MSYKRGVITAASTNHGGHQDRPKLAKTLVNQGLGFFLPSVLPVSSGLDQSPLDHRFGTNPAHVLSAEQRTAAYGTRECQAFRQRIFADLQPIASELAHRYVRTAERFDYVRANRELLEFHERLRVHDLNLCANLDELQKASERLAGKCLRLRRRYAKDDSQALAVCLKLVERYGISPPNFLPSAPDPFFNRLSCPRWWSRKIRVLRLRRLEEIARHITLVSKFRSSYASDHVMRLKREQKHRVREYLESAYITNESGECYSLQALADCSVSNPAIRRAELMVRIKGFEMVAQLCGHVGEFYTLTVPSRMHACLHNGQQNPHFAGTTPLQAHRYLVHIWGLIRAELHRRGIQPYGFRVVEPHHDGTPHWHVLLFLSPEQRTAMREVMRHYALLDSGDEPGAQTHRFKAIAIDPAKGTAAGYIAKYIAKNIDGHALEEDRHGNKAQDAAEKITTWANVWGIRQFQQIGGPSVTVWRQLRKLGQVEDGELDTIRQSTTASDWAAFTLAMGGPYTPKSAHTIKPLYDHGRQLVEETGEIVPTLVGRYGDESPLGVVGVVWQGKGYDSRKHYWTSPKREGSKEVVAPDKQSAAVLGASSRYKWTVFKALSGERFEKISTGVQEYETKYFGTYKSYVSADTNTTQYNDNRAIFWKNKLFLIGLAFVLCVFVLSPMYLKKIFSVDDSPLVHKSTTSPAQQQTKQVQAPAPAPVKQVVTSTPTPELVNPEFDYIADLAKSNRIRLVSVLQFSNKTFVVIEFRDSSFRVIDRFDSKMLDSLGWSVDVVSTQLVRVKKGNGQNFVATAWPLESVGRVSEQQNFSIRQSSTGIVTDVR